VQGNMPHAEKGRNADAPANEYAVPLRSEELLAETAGSA